MSFNETNFDRTNVDARVLTDDEQDVDEFKRFHHDVLRAIEPLQNQIVPHHEGFDDPALNSSEPYSASLSASPRHKLSFTGTMIGAVVAGVVIGAAIAAMGTERFRTTYFSVSHSLARLFGALPDAASVGGAPMTPDDLTTQAGPADRQAGGADDQGPAPPQTATSEAPSQPADVQQPAPAAADNDKSIPSGKAEDAPSSISKSVPVLANDSGSSLSVTMPPKDNSGLARKFSDVQASRNKPQVLRGRSGAKLASRPKVLRPRAAVPDVSIDRPGSSSRTRRGLDQGKRKDLRDEAASPRDPTR